MMDLTAEAYGNALNGGNTFESGNDGNDLTMHEHSVTDIEQMNAKIQHMEINNMLFETEPKIQDKSTYLTPAMISSPQTSN